MDSNTMTDDLIDLTHHPPSFQSIPSNTDSSHTISVMTWNLLAPCYLNPNKIPHIPPEYCDYNTSRFPRIVSMIQASNNDVVCLQEVGSNENLIDTLTSIGYHVIFRPRGTYATKLKLSHFNNQIHSNNSNTHHNDNNPNVNKDNLSNNPQFPAVSDSTPLDRVDMSITTPTVVFTPLISQSTDTTPSPNNEILHPQSQPQYNSNSNPAENDFSNNNNNNNNGKNKKRTLGFEPLHFHQTTLHPSRLLSNHDNSDIHDHNDDIAKNYFDQINQHMKTYFYDSTVLLSHILYTTAMTYSRQHIAQFTPLGSMPQSSSSATSFTDIHQSATNINEIYTNHHNTLIDLVDFSPLFQHLALPFNPYQVSLNTHLPILPYNDNTTSLYDPHCLKYRNNPIINVITHRPKNDGLLIAYKADKFDLALLPLELDLNILGYDVVFKDEPFSQLQHSHHKQYGTPKYTNKSQIESINVNNRMLRDNIALITVLRPKKSLTNDFFVISSTHLFFSPLFEDVKLLQSLLITRVIRQLVSFIRQKQHSAQVFSLLCGDFNITPGSAVFQVLNGAIIDKVECIDSTHPQSGDLLNNQIPKSPTEERVTKAQQIRDQQHKQFRRTPATFASTTNPNPPINAANNENGNDSGTIPNEHNHSLQLKIDVNNLNSSESDVKPQVNCFQTDSPPQTKPIELITRRSAAQHNSIDLTLAIARLKRTFFHQFSHDNFIKSLAYYSQPSYDNRQPSQLPITVSNRAKSHNIVLPLIWEYYLRYMKPTMNDSKHASIHNVKCTLPINSGTDTLTICTMACPNHTTFHANHNPPCISPCNDYTSFHLTSLPITSNNIIPQADNQNHTPILPLPCNIPTPPIVLVGDLVAVSRTLRGLGVDTIHVRIQPSTGFFPAHITSLSQYLSPTKISPRYPHESSLINPAPNENLDISHIGNVHYKMNEVDPVLAPPVYHELIFFSHQYKRILVTAIPGIVVYYSSLLKVNEGKMDESSMFIAPLAHRYQYTALELPLMIYLPPVQSSYRTESINDFYFVQQFAALRAFFEIIYPVNTPMHCFNIPTFPKQYPFNTPNKKLNKIMNALLLFPSPILPMKKSRKQEREERKLRKQRKNLMNMPFQETSWVGTKNANSINISDRNLDDDEDDEGDEDDEDDEDNDDNNHNIHNTTSNRIRNNNNYYNTGSDVMETIDASSLSIHRIFDFSTNSAPIGALYARLLNLHAALVNFGPQTPPSRTKLELAKPNRNNIRITALFGVLQSGIPVNRMLTRCTHCNSMIASHNKGCGNIHHCVNPIYSPCISSASPAPINAVSNDNDEVDLGMPLSSSKCEQMKCVQCVDYYVGGYCSLFPSYLQSTYFNNHKYDQQLYQLTTSTATALSQNITAPTSYKPYSFNYNHQILTNHYLRITNQSPQDLLHNHNIYNHHVVLDTKQTPSQLINLVSMVCEKNPKLRRQLTYMLFRNNVYYNKVYFNHLVRNLPTYHKQYDSIMEYNYDVHLILHGLDTKLFIPQGIISREIEQPEHPPLQLMKYDMPHQTGLFIEAVNDKQTGQNVITALFSRKIMLAWLVGALGPSALFASQLDFFNRYLETNGGNSHLLMTNDYDSTDVSCTDDDYYLSQQLSIGHNTSKISPTRSLNIDEDELLTKPRLFKKKMWKKMKESQSIEQQQEYIRMTQQTHHKGSQTTLTQLHALPQTESNNFSCPQSFMINSIDKESHWVSEYNRLHRNMVVTRSDNDIARLTDPETPSVHIHETAAPTVPTTTTQTPAKDYITKNKKYIQMALEATDGDDNGTNDDNLDIYALSPTLPVPDPNATKLYLTDGLHRLAKTLRTLGLDTLYGDPPNIPKGSTESAKMAQIFAICHREQRILITNSKNVLQRRDVPPHILLPPSLPSVLQPDVMTDISGGVAQLDQRNVFNDSPDSVDKTILQKHNPQNQKKISLFDYYVYLVKKNLNIQYNFETLYIRCTLCNHLFKSLCLADVRSMPHLPSSIKTGRNKKDNSILHFYQCLGCSQVYWWGSKSTSMCLQLENLFGKDIIPTQVKSQETTEGLSQHQTQSRYKQQFGEMVDQYDIKKQQHSIFNEIDANLEGKGKVVQRHDLSQLDLWTGKWHFTTQSGRPKTAIFTTAQSSVSDTHPLANGHHNVYFTHDRNSNHLPTMTTTITTSIPSNDITLLTLRPPCSLQKQKTDLSTSEYKVPINWNGNSSILQSLQHPLLFGCFLSHTYVSNRGDNANDGNTENSNKNSNSNSTSYNDLLFVKVFCKADIVSQSVYSHPTTAFTSAALNVAMHPNWTNFVSEYQGCLDYIFHYTPTNQKTRIQVNQALSFAKCLINNPEMRTTNCNCVTHDDLECSTNVNICQNAAHHFLNRLIIDTHTDQPYLYQFNNASTVKPPYPNQVIPSDHCPISAKLQIIDG